MAVTHIPQASVILMEDHLLINNFKVDGAIVDVIHQSEQRGGPSDPEDLVRRAVQIGGETLLVGLSRMTVLPVAHEIERLARVLQDETGAIPEAVKAQVLPLVGELTTVLGGYFDPSKTGSVQEQIRRLVEANSATQLTSALRELLAENGPLALMNGRLVNELKLVGTPLHDTLGRIGDLLAKLESKLASDLVVDRSVLKGRPFEAVIHAELDAIFSPFGDEVIFVGDQAGALPGTRAGDFLVQINPADTGGLIIWIVVEAKTGKLSRPRTMAELEEGMANREALAGIIVFDEAKDAPLGGRDYCPYPDRKFVAVFDKDEPNPLALEVACRTARCLAIAAARLDCGLDAAWLTDQVEELRGMVDDLRQIRAGISMIRSGTTKTEDSSALVTRRAKELLQSFEERLASS
jgi:hypothetical protein